MRHLKSQTRILLLAIISLTLLSAGIGNYFPPSLKQIINSGHPVNILLMGIDARPGEVDARSDTMILASYDHSLQKAVMVWIPRDTRIMYKGKPTKINMVNQLEGPRAACREVGNLLNLQVEHYVVTNFSGFEKIIDVLGGVYMDVDIRISSPGTNVFLSKGYQRLSGRQALTYVRFRGTLDGDIGRTARQQRLIKALMEQLLNGSTIPKLPELMAIVKDNARTNISLADMAFIANLGLGLKRDNIAVQTLPGHHYVDPASGASYWEVDGQVAASIVPSLYRDHYYH
jgi:LCP family protein required for cell wall assembly